MPSAFFFAQQRMGKTIYNIEGARKLWHVYAATSQEPVAGPFYRLVDAVNWTKEARARERIEHAKSRKLHRNP